MNRADFDEYISRFNQRDATAFDQYIHPRMKMVNGALEFTGIAGMRDHYENKIWPFFTEDLHVLKFVSDDATVAVQMWAHFTAKDDAETLFGVVKRGETFDFRGLIIYDILDGKFSTITVAYNSFENTKITGEKIEMGMPH